MTLLLSHTPRRPDLYIGLVAAAGTELNEVKAQLKAQLAVVGYTERLIKVSDLIISLTGIAPETDEFERISKLQKAGDHCRANSENGWGVAAAAIAEIRRVRDDEKLNNSPSVAYIIDSFKNPAEIELFDLVYSRNFYTVSVYRDKSHRLESLRRLIARSRHEPPSDNHLELAKDLIEFDEKSSGKKAQNVRDTFAKADYFINGHRDVNAQCERFINLVFGKPFISSTKDEYGMFTARAAGLRSVDLSRQVGAAIFSSSMRIISTGCNEVPYPGGGFFNFPYTGIGDNRDYTQRVDPNFVEIQRSIIQLLKVLQGANLVDPSQDANRLADSLLSGEHKELMADARVRNLVEFGRVVHAEMHAICEAAAGGKATEGGTLYSTAFPCHGCARHIIAAGLAEVVYIEPYPKSLALQLYADEFAPIGNTETNREDRRLQLRPFHGIAPALYPRVFNHRASKDEWGTIPEWKPLMAKPVGAVHSDERQNIELAASNSVADVVEKFQLSEKSGGEQADDAEFTGSSIA